MIAHLLRTTREDADRARLAQQIESGDLAPLLDELHDLSAARRRLIADAAGEPDEPHATTDLGDLRQPSYWLATIAAILEHQTAALLALRPEPRAPIFGAGVAVGIILGLLLR